MDTMDDVSFNADHISKQDKATVYFSGKDAHLFYRFTWADEQHGIAKCEINMHTAKVIKFFINQTNAGKVKMVKGGSADCLAG